MLQLSRPLACFDLETTGTNPAEDRIVELSVVLLEPGEPGEPGQPPRRSTRSWLVNPGRPIPAGATAVHGISDEDVKDAPAFAEVARAVLETFEGADLSGFNAERFDVPLLAAEFKRVDVAFPAPGIRVIDSHALFVQRERRDLAAAVQFYCGRSHAGAHRAEADAVAAADVLLAQLERYDDLPRDVEALHEHLHPVDPSWVDGQGKIAWEGEAAVLTFGKHRGRTLQDLVAEEADYLRWMLKKDFPVDTQRILTDALDGRFPARD